jgi:hypothetical protein
MKLRTTVFVVAIGLAAQAIWAEQPNNLLLGSKAKTSASQPATPSAETTGNGTRPNILFFFADDQRNHCAGHPIVKTPNLDHNLRRDPDQRVNIAARPVGQQSEAHQHALATLRTRCDELIAQNGPAMQDLRPAPKKQPRKKRPAKE